MTGKSDSAKVRRSEKVNGKNPDSWLQEDEVEEEEKKRKHNKKERRGTGRAILPKAPFSVSPKLLKKMRSELHSFKVNPELTGSKCLSILDEKRGAIRASDWIRFAVIWGKEVFRHPEEVGGLSEECRDTWYQVCDMISTLTKREITREEAFACRKLSWDTLTKIERCFAVSLLTVNLHKVGHLADNIIKWGPSYALW